MICAQCNSDYSDGVECGACRRALCFNCSGISESGYRKLGTDRRAMWKCPTCKIASPNPANPPAVSLETVLKEVREMKQQLVGLPVLIQEFNNLKTELSEVKKSCQFNSDKLEDFSKRLDDADKKLAEVHSLRNSLQTAVNTIDELKRQITTTEQWSRLNNVEIKGIPLKKDENLFSIVEKLGSKCGYTVPKTQINYISRVPTYNSKGKAIILSFLNRYVKEEFIATARACKDLKACDLGFSGDTQRIFVNDHLTPDMKNLLTKSKSKAAEMGYQYKWVKYGKIHVRKNDTSPVIIISKSSDLNKIV